MYVNIKMTISYLFCAFNRIVYISIYQLGVRSHIGLFKLPSAALNQSLGHMNFRQKELGPVDDYFIDRRYLFI